LLHYGIPLLQGHLPQDYIENFQALSQVTELAYQHRIMSEDLYLLQSLAPEFVMEYESLYVDGDIRRLNAMKVFINLLISLSMILTFKRYR